MTIGVTQKLPETRDSKGMLYGGYVGVLKAWIDNAGDNFNKDDALLDIFVMKQIVESINNKGHVCVNDIKARLTNDSTDESLFNVTLISMLFGIAPLAFADIFGLHGHDLDSMVKEIASITCDGESYTNLCVEYVHLLHDILWFKLDKQGIIDILPELNTDEAPKVGEVVDIKTIFNVALWVFLHSNNYADCYELTSTVENILPYTIGIACTLAGLYYGVESIPTDYFVQVFEEIDEELPIL